MEFISPDNRRSLPMDNGRTGNISGKEGDSYYLVASNSPMYLAVPPIAFKQMIILHIET